MEEAGGGKKLVRREVTRIVTPGTAMDGNLVRARENNYLAAVALAGGYTEKSEDGFVYVRRYGETEEVRMAADPTTVIEPGDIVRIRTSMFWRLIDIAGPVSAIVSTRWYLPVPGP